MNFKTEDEIFETLWEYFTSECPDVTFKKKGGVAWGLLRTAAYGIRLGYVIIEKLHNAIWATFGDLPGLRKWKEVLALPWSDNETKKDARADVLEKFRESGLGTVGWYEDRAVARFDEAAQAFGMIGRRGPNTLDLLVVNDAGGDVVGLQDIQDYFDDPGRRVGHIDVRVITVSDYKGQTDSAYESWGGV